MAPGLPYAIGIAAREPRTAGDRVRRRRRLRDADGGVQHRVPVRAAGEGGHQQQQLRSARSSGSRWSSATRSTVCASTSRSRTTRRGHVAAAATACTSPRPRTLPRRDRRGVRLTTARRWSTSRSIRTSRRCRARSPTSRRRSSREAFLKGQPHKAAIATTLFKDRIQQLKARYGRGRYMATSMSVCRAFDRPTMGSTATVWQRRCARASAARSPSTPALARCTRPMRPTTARCPSAL